MKKPILKTSGYLLALLCLCGVASLVLRRQASLQASSLSSGAWNRLTANLKLTTDAAQPSGLVSDEIFRAQLQAKLIEESANTPCTSVQNAYIADVGTSAKFYLASFVLGSDPTRYAMMLRVPNGRKNLPLVVYATSGFMDVDDFSEVSTALGASIENVVTAVPFFYGEKFKFGAKTYLAPGQKEQNNLFAEARVLYGAVRCLQTQANRLALFDASPLSGLLQRAYSVHGGFRLALIGAGRGGLTVAQTAALAGANFMDGKTAIADVAHIDAVVQLNPLQSLTAAENRLWLASLVGGYTNETRYGAVPGVIGFEHGFATPYRLGMKSEAVMTMEVAKRDVNILAPFINLGIKNFAFASNTKGLRAGAMLTLQGKKRGDFTANGSRIFANVMATVEFATTKQTNGLNHHYREFADDVKEAKQDSFARIFSDSFLNARSQQVDDIFIVLSDTTQATPDLYNWLMRGRAFALLGESAPQRLVQDFLASTVNTK